MATLEYIDVHDMPSPRPPGHPGWETVEVYRGRDDKVTTFDTKEGAVNYGDFLARKHNVPLIVQGQKVLDLEYVDDWRGTELVETSAYGEFGGFR